MSNQATDHAVLEHVWALLEGRSDALRSVVLEGPRALLPSVYAVDALASASIAASTLAIAEFQAVRTQQPLRTVRVDRRHAAAAFRSERYLRAVGWQLPEVWDPLAGDYATRDGFIRLHTNYSYHRDAALRVLDVAPEREAVARAVAGWAGEQLETAIVAEGGCAALMRAPDEWAEHPQGRALAQEPVFARRDWPARVVLPPADAALRAPLAGVRVLDLTRVIAGPVCTRVLAAFGADVLRIDPPQFQEVPALLGDTTAGKRRAALDLTADRDRAQFEALVAGAHVLVHGYRSDALERLGFGPDRLRSLNPGLVVACHDAYGWTGPWARRRGFDSLVQMSCGIAFRGKQAKASERPSPLPAQALDHGTGYLLAAAACRSLTRLLVDARASEMRLSLARTARLLMDLGDAHDPGGADFSALDAEPWLEDGASAFGPVRRVRCPGEIDGVTAHWSRPAGPLGVDAATW